MIEEIIKNACLTASGRKLFSSEQNWSVTTNLDTPITIKKMHSIKSFLEVIVWFKTSYSEIKKRSL